MKKYFIAILMLLLSLSLFANGSKEREATVVTIWHCNDGINGKAFDSLVDKFNEGIGREKGIVIEAIYQGAANDVLTKVKASSLNSSLPDIAQMDASAALEMNAAPYLVTVDQLNASVSDLIIQAKNAFTSERGLIAMPFNASSLLLYYNKSLFDRLGLSEPRTIDDLIVIARTIKERESNISAFVGVPTTYELTTFIGAQRGLSYIVDNKNGHTGLPERALFAEDGTYKAFLEKWKELYDTGAINNATKGTTNEFLAGNAASMLASSSKLSSLIKQVGSSFELGVAAVPLVNEDATGGVALSGGALFSFTNTEAVKTVLEYLTSKASQLYWAEETGYIPLNEMAINSSELKSYLEKNPLYGVALSSVLASRAELTNVWLPSAYQIYYAFQTNINDVCLDKLSIDSAVEEMKKTIEDALSSYKSQNF